MYLRILKKDLTRKRTMNLILFIFITLATMFISGSVNNIMTVTTALDRYFDMAGMSDYYFCIRNLGNERQDMAAMMESLSHVTSYHVEPLFFVTNEGIIKKGDEQTNVSSAITAIISSFDDAGITYFKEDDTPLTQVKQGEVYLPANVLTREDLHIGDTITITIGENSVHLIVMGRFKDAMFGSDMMSNDRFLINGDDFAYLNDSDAALPYSGSLAYINSDDVNALANEISTSFDNSLFAEPKATLKMMYVMDMLIAGILLIFSIFIIMIAFIVLRFTIRFTLEEEFREIGVMKAIGIQNRKIRNLYLIKYITLALIGALLGCLLSIPFGEMLLSGVSQNIVIQHNYGYSIHILAAILVALTVAFFAFGCTFHLRKVTPMDAIRNGENGERYHKKGLLTLRERMIPVPLFLALNDIFSQGKRYIMMLITFTLSLLLVVILANSANTLKSDHLVTSFGMIESDLYMVKTDQSDSFFHQEGEARMRHHLQEIADNLKAHGMNADVSINMMMKLSLRYKDRSCKSIVLYGVNSKAENYTYIEGTPPQRANEIAITPIISERLHVSIGDMITITDINGEKEYLITALFQSMMNMGEGVRLHESAQISFSQLVGFSAFQIKFTDDPDSTTIQDRLNQIQALYPEGEVYKGGAYIDDIIGNISVIVNELKYLVICIVMIMSILITVLMERSFLSKEKSEIALLKAIGFQNKTLVRWHTLRIAIILLVSAILCALLAHPMTYLTITPIFQMMGAESITFDIRIWEVFILYPLMMSAIILFAAWLSASAISHISADQTSSIE